MKAIYIAHPLGNGPERERNRANASLWCALLAEQFGIAPIADWIVLSSVWSEAKRDLGMAIDFELIRRCDQTWMVGGRISPGMMAERSHSALCHTRMPVDLTSVGYGAPGPGSERFQLLVSLLSKAGAL